MNPVLAYFLGVLTPVALAAIYAAYLDFGLNRDVGKLK